MDEFTPRSRFARATAGLPTTPRRDPHYELSIADTISRSPRAHLRLDAQRTHGADLRRDPRFALHSATVDPVEGSEANWPGEAKISGRAIAAGPITEGPAGDHFRADIAEVVHTHLNAVATLLIVDWWTPAQGLRRLERE